MLKFKVKVGSCLDTWVITEAESKAINNMKCPCFIGLDKNNKILGYYFAHTRRSNSCDYEGVMRFKGIKSSSWGISVCSSLIKWYNSSGNIEPRATTCIVKDIGSLEDISGPEVSLFE
ncbi:MAG: hypothetical protein J6Q39_04205 [Bacteroidales bacterium]|nr:hypothetical protein [Bacteroidales bacterium]